MDPELAAAMALSMQPGGGDGGGGEHSGGTAAQLADLLSRGGVAPAALRTASSTLRKVLTNLGSHPSEPKYRRLRVGNKQIQSRILSLDGGEAFLLAIGFAPSAASEDQPAGAFLEIMEAAAPSAAYAGVAALDVLDARRAPGEFTLSRELPAHGCEVSTVFAPEHLSRNDGAAASPASTAALTGQGDTFGGCRFPRAALQVRAVAGLPDGTVATGASDNLVRIFPADGLGGEGARASSSRCAPAVLPARPPPPGQIESSPAAAVMLCCEWLGPGRWAGAWQTRRVCWRHTSRAKE
jgi:hypothetical protein